MMMSSVTQLISFLTLKAMRCVKFSSPYRYWGLIFPSSIFHISLLKEVELICVFNESISPQASTVMNLVKSPSIAAAEI